MDKDQLITVTIEKQNGEQISRRYRVSDDDINTLHWRGIIASMWDTLSGE
jgi:hypothetical protein